MILSRDIIQNISFSGALRLALIDVLQGRSEMLYKVLIAIEIDFWVICSELSIIVYPPSLYFELSELITHG